VLAEFSEKDEPKVKEDEPTTQQIEDPLPMVREVISDVVHGVFWYTKHVHYSLV
jgi:hypothetical protein